MPQSELNAREFENMEANGTLQENLHAAAELYDGTKNKVFTYENDFKEFFEARKNGCEIDSEMFYYWLEVLPPVYMKQRHVIDGKEIYCSFGFAEGWEEITDFWIKDERYFCKLSNRMNLRG